MKRGYKIFAVDFDGTLCSERFPGIGSPNMSLIRCLIDKKTSGDKLILWTCRTGERLSEAVDWCAEHGLHFDAVNENLPDMIALYGSDTRKVFADYYIDDKALRG